MAQLDARWSGVTLFLFLTSVALTLEGVAPWAFSLDVFSNTLRRSL